MIVTVRHSVSSVEQREQRRIDEAALFAKVAHHTEVSLKDIEAAFRSARVQA